ncbi:MAG: hypothetical protein ACI8ZB_004560 [Desulforhopalus sp.]|jgi:hypothetical protein
MSEDIGKARKKNKTTHQQPIQIAEKTPNVNSLKKNRVCVIITQKKNSSWVDDLDARERLNKCQRVFH